MKHTHGTWHAKDGQIYPIETGVTIALIPYFDKTNEEQKANAKLIESAPDMLNMVEDIIEDLRLMDEDELNHFEKRLLNKCEDIINKLNS